MTTVDDQLLYEARVRTRQALIAGGAAVLLLVAAILQSVGPQPKVNELTVQLLVTNQRGGLEIGGAAVDAIALLAVAATLNFLFAAIRARRPQTQQAVRVAAVGGAVLAAVASLIYSVVIVIKAHQFATQGLQSYSEAHQLLSGSGFAVLQVLGLLSDLLLALGYVLISLSAMRVGLLPKFMGYLGIVAGVASMLLVGSPPAVLLQVVWLSALAYLLSGRWPSGTPPAWRSGKAEPWPSAAQMREERAQTGRGGARGKAATTPAPETVAATTPARTRSETPKRKRKRRR
jgi:hypothetical protein